MTILEETLKTLYGDDTVLYTGDVSLSELDAVLSQNYLDHFCKAHLNSEDASFYGNLEVIHNVLSNHFSITPQLMFARSKQTAFTEIRQLFFYFSVLFLCKKSPKKFKITYDQVGMFPHVKYGVLPWKRSIVRYSYETVMGELDIYASKRALIYNLTEKIVPSLSFKIN